MGQSTGNPNGAWRAAFPAQLHLVDDREVDHLSLNLNLPRRGRLVTVLEEVRTFVARLSPEAACDDCISERLGLSIRQHANHKTRELAGSDGFERRKGPCSLCGSDKMVIRRA